MRTARAVIGLFCFHKLLTLNGLQRIFGFFNGEKTACFFEGPRESQSASSMRSGELPISSPIKAANGEPK
jgi:hypothetical protein